MTHSLVIDRDAHKRLLTLRARAAAAVVPYAQWMMRTNLVGKKLSYEMPDAAHVSVEVGYDVAFEHVEARPGVVARFLAIAGPNELPAPQAVGVLMQLMGFTRGPTQCMVFTSEMSPGRHAVNVVEPLAGELSQLTTPPVPMLMH